MTAFGGDRGVEIAPHLSKNRESWFFATSVLKTNMTNVWVRRVFLIVTVNLVRNK